MGQPRGNWSEVGQRPTRRKSVRWMATVPTLVALCWLPACGGSDDPGDAASSSTTAPATTESTDTTASASTVATTTTTGAATTTTDAPEGTSTTSAAAATPDPSGWLAVDAIAGHPLDVAPLDDAIATVATVLGAPSSDAVNTECGAGELRIVQWDGLDLLSYGDTVDGWVYTGTTPAMSTPSGVTVGTTAADLERLFPDGEVSEDTVGPEFFVTIETSSGPRFLGVLLDGSGPTGTARLLYAGLTCFFR